MAHNKVKQWYLAKTFSKDIEKSKYYLIYQQIMKH